MKTFELNGVKYPAKELEFEQIVDLQENGIDFFNATGISAIRGYLMVCADVDKSEASKLLEDALIEIGDIDGAYKGISDAMKSAIEESGFFRRVKEMAEKKNQKLNLFYFLNHL